MSPTLHAESCATIVGGGIVEMLNVSATADMPERVRKMVEQHGSKALAAMPELRTVLNEAVNISRERGAALSITLDHTNKTPSVLVSLDLPNSPNDGAVRRMEGGQNPAGEEITTTRFDIDVKTTEIRVTPGESKAVRTAEGLMVRSMTNHQWGLSITDPPNEDIVIDAHEMRIERYVGDKAIPLYRRGLLLAMRLARALQPGDRILLNAGRLTFEQKAGQWQPLPAPR